MYDCIQIQFHCYPILSQRNNLLLLPIKLCVFCVWVVCIFWGYFFTEQTKKNRKTLFAISWDDKKLRNCAKKKERKEWKDRCQKQAAEKPTHTHTHTTILNFFRFDFNVRPKYSCTILSCVFQGFIP